MEPQIVDQLEPGEITQHLMGAEAPGSPKETNEELLLLESDPGEETDEGASSSSLHTIPIKNPRGRKSKKKKREEATYLAVLEGSQKTLKGIMHTRSKKRNSSGLKRGQPLLPYPLMKYISWNCRGLGSSLKEDAMRDLIRIHKP